MIDFLKVNIISPPKNINFPLKRKVLTEKYIEPSSVFGDFKHLKETILTEGEHIWTINTTSLDLERITFSMVPNEFEGTRFCFLYHNENNRGIRIKLMNYLTSINSMTPTYFTGLSGHRILCSSELELLKKLEIYIPNFINKIKISIKANGLSVDKIKNKRLKIKELERLHKTIVKHLEKINN